MTTECAQSDPSAHPGPGPAVRPQRTHADPSHGLSPPRRTPARRSPPPRARPRCAPPGPRGRAPAGAWSASTAPTPRSTDSWRSSATTARPRGPSRLAVGSSARITAGRPMRCAPDPHPLALPSGKTAGTASAFSARPAPRAGRAPPGPPAGATGRARPRRTPGSRTRWGYPDEVGRLEDEADLVAPVSVPLLARQGVEVDPGDLAGPAVGREQPSGDRQQGRLPGAQDPTTATSSPRSTCRSTPFSAGSPS